MWAASTSSSGGGHANGVAVASSTVMAFNNSYSIYEIDNDVHFCAEVSYESMHALTRVLKTAAVKRKEAAEEMRTKVLDKVTTSEKKGVHLVCEPAPIRLVLTTHGGYLNAAWAMVDTITRLGVPVHTEVSGFVASAGTLLSMAGTRRTITPHSKMLLHELRAGFWGKHSDNKDRIDDMDKSMDKIVEFYAQRSKLQSESMVELLRRDREWNAEECLGHGIVDEIL